MITILRKSANYDPENIKFFHNLSHFFFGNKLFSSFVIVFALLARVPKHSKRKVVSGSWVTLPENFARKPGLSFNPLARVTKYNMCHLGGDSCIKTIRGWTSTWFVFKEAFV